MNRGWPRRQFRSGDAAPINPAFERAFRQRYGRRPYAIERILAWSQAEDQRRRAVGASDVDVMSMTGVGGKSSLTSVILFVGILVGGIWIFQKG